MRRGDVYLVNLEPAHGSEANKTRPAVVVSGDAANRIVERTGQGVLTVLPITSSVTRVHEFQVLLAAGVGGLDRESKVQAEQVRAVAPARLGRRLGSLPMAAMAQVDRALRVHLAL
jgi:mRNA interferase MazF